MAGEGSSLLITGTMSVESGHGERPEGLSPNALPVTTPRSLADVRIANGKVTVYKTTGAEK